MASFGKTSNNKDHEILIVKKRPRETLRICLLDYTYVYIFGKNKRIVRTREHFYVCTPPFMKSYFHIYILCIFLIY